MQKVIEQQIDFINEYLKRDIKFCKADATGDGNTSTGEFVAQCQSALPAIIPKDKHFAFNEIKGDPRALGGTIDNARWALGITIQGRFFTSSDELLMCGTKGSGAFFEFTSLEAAPGKPLKIPPQALTEEKIAILLNAIKSFLKAHLRHCSREVGLDIREELKTIEGLLEAEREEPTTEGKSQGAGRPKEWTDEYKEDLRLLIVDGKTWPEIRDFMQHKIGSPHANTYSAAGQRFFAGLKKQVKDRKKKA